MENTVFMMQKCNFLMKIKIFMMKTNAVFNEKSMKSAWAQRAAVGGCGPRWPRRAPRERHVNQESSIHVSNSRKRMHKRCVLLSFVSCAEIRHAVAKLRFSFSCVVLFVVAASTEISVFTC